MSVTRTVEWAAIEADASRLAANVMVFSGQIQLFQLTCRASMNTFTVNADNMIVCVCVLWGDEAPGEREEMGEGG